MTRMKLLATGLVLACAGMASVARAVDREAPGIYSTIDLAIAAAVVGQDRVVIGGDVTNGSFTLNKAIEVTLKPGEAAHTITAASGAQYCAQITASGGKITNLTLKGGSIGVVDVGPGTVQYCRIEDVSGTLQYDPAVVMGSSSGQFLDNTIIRTTSAKCVELSAAGSVKRCTLTISATPQNDYAAVKTTSSSGGTIENNVITFASGLSNTTRGIESRYGNATIQYNTVKRATRGIDIEGGSNLITFNRARVQFTHFLR